eukprot:403337683
MSQIRTSTQVHNHDSNVRGSSHNPRDRLRSRERIATGHQILNVRDRQNNNNDDPTLQQQNRLKTMKANYQNQNDQELGQRGGSLQNASRYNKLNSTITNSPSKQLDSGLVLNNNGKIMNSRGGSIGQSRGSVSTKKVEELLNNTNYQNGFSTQPVSPRLNINHRRGQSFNNQSFLDNLENQDQLNQRQSYYDSSPVERHYGATFSQNSTVNSFNKRLKMRDTFTKIFPGYTHGQPSVFKNENQLPSTTHSQFVYPEQMEGKPTYAIDRTFTKKNDFIKIYTEEILKIANMRGNKK